MDYLRKIYKESSRYYRAFQKQFFDFYLVICVDLEGNIIGEHKNHNPVFPLRFPQLTLGS